ncbi:hypothetical protein Lser_V15G19743 [Lactuca serriola]
MDLDDAKPPPVSTMYTVPPPHDANGNVNMDTHATQLNAGDQVVREIDVLHTSSADVNSKLYVLQYPLRQQWRPHNLQERCKKVKLNPQTAEVKIDLNVDGDKAMANQVLSTSWKPPSITDYAVGILKGYELHLKYVNAVVQLRPSMQHLKPLKKMNTSHADVDMIDSEDIKEEKDIKQKKLNEQNEDTKEELISLKYHGESSQLSHRTMQNMVKAQEASSQIQFSINALSVSALLKLPLEERYKTMLSEGRPLQFNTFKHIAPDSSVEDIFKVLQSHAQLVQGLWVSKCKLKYDEDGRKNVLIRDYMMLLFSKNPIVRDTQLPEAPEKMKDILHKFASRRECFKDWKFKELRDDLFIKEYPNIVEEQKKIWDHMEPQLIECLISKNLKHGIDHMRTTLTINNNNNNKNNVETKTTSVSTPSRGVKLDETQEALIKVFKYQKVCSLNKIHQRLRVMNVNTSQEELLKTLNQVAVNIHGVFVSKSSSDHPQYDDFRNVVINLLVAQGPKARLRRRSIEAAASMQLKRVPNNTEFRKVITEMCTSQSSRWVLKSGD